MLAGSAIVLEQWMNVVVMDDDVYAIAMNQWRMVVVTSSGVRFTF